MEVADDEFGNQNQKPDISNDVELEKTNQIEKPASRQSSMVMSIKYSNSLVQQSLILNIEVSNDACSPSALADVVDATKECQIPRVDHN
jgi:hypothetical protein